MEARLWLSVSIVKAFDMSRAATRILRDRMVVAPKLILDLEGVDMVRLQSAVMRDDGVGIGKSGSRMPPVDLGEAWAVLASVAAGILPSSDEVSNPMCYGRGCGWSRSSAG